MLQNNKDDEMLFEKKKKYNYTSSHIKRVT